ncbi:hypothetical protein EDD22DRAFT_907531 [Suillus occidentalis]|nr:hypothetical protein EDD22DRAFT_907531 [Suillus occidentalis]
MGCASSLQRPLKTLSIRPLPEDLQDSNFLHLEASDTSKTIIVVDGSLSLPIESILEKPVQPLLEHHENSELQLEVSNPSTTIITQVGIFSLPAELLCHIMLLLHFKDLYHCALACKIFWHVAQNCADIQCLFELHAQGFTETPTLDWVDVSSKMYSLKKLASTWRSDFHLNPVFEEIVTVNDSDSLDMQSVKCGVWWMEAGRRLFIRWCDTNTKPPQTWLEQSLPASMSLGDMGSVVVDPLQDLAVAMLYGNPYNQERHIFSLVFQLASSQHPHPDAVCTSLKCKHPCVVIPGCWVRFVGRPAICGERIVVVYYTNKWSSGLDMLASNIFIQVIDWRKGRAKGYPLYELGGREAGFRLLDGQRIIVIGPDGRMTLYTLPELGGLPQRRISVYPSESAHSDLMPDYVTSLESQIMVIEVFSRTSQVILVIDMAIFSIKAAYSDIPIEIPWSEWGPNKMTYALPQDHTPEPGQRLEELPAEGSFYVHIWDFNKAIARSERLDNVHTYNSPGRLIRRPGRLAQSCFDNDDAGIITNHPYTTAVCPTGFSTRYFDQFFLEQDRLTLIWARPGSVQVKIVSPSPIMPTSEVGLDVGQGRIAHSPEQSQQTK